MSKQDLVRQLINIRVMLTKNAAVLLFSIELFVIKFISSQLHSRTHEGANRFQRVKKSKNINYTNNLLLKQTSGAM